MEEKLGLRVKRRNGTTVYYEYYYKNGGVNKNTLLNVYNLVQCKMKAIT